MVTQEEKVTASNPQYSLDLAAYTPTKEPGYIQNTPEVVKRSDVHS